MYIILITEGNSYLEAVGCFVSLRCHLSPFLLTINKIIISKAGYDMNPNQILTGMSLSWQGKAKGAGLSMGATIGKKWVVVFLLAGRSCSEPKDPAKAEWALSWLKLFIKCFCEHLLFVPYCFNYASRCRERHTRTTLFQAYLWKDFSSANSLNFKKILIVWVKIWAQMCDHIRENSMEIKWNEAPSLILLSNICHCIKNNYFGSLEGSRRCCFFKKKQTNLEFYIETNKLLRLLSFEKDILNCTFYLNVGQFNLDYCFWQLASCWAALVSLAVWQVMNLDPWRLTPHLGNSPTRTVLRLWQVTNPLKGSQGRAGLGGLSKYGNSLVTFIEYFCWEKKWSGREGMGHGI